MNISQVIVKQGDKGDKFFIIAEGKVVVTQTNDKGETGVVAELGPAQYFGEKYYGGTVCIEERGVKVI